ncbi:MAG: alpha,alpha-trehalase ath1 [Claussenomyces sp. TS43310]|nr:MAG: alpha,alpha-trehalase ath1 [Claussenomyces sp. TS43310]
MSSAQTVTKLLRMLPMATLAKLFHPKEVDIGSRKAPMGVGKAVRLGWPLDQPRATFGTIAGFWNLQEKVKYPSLPENVLRGGESVISGIPDWTGIVITTDNGECYMPGVHPSTILGYRQSISLQDGVVHTNVTWKPQNQDAVFQLNFTVLAHRTRVNLGLVRLDMAVDRSARFTVTDVLDGAGASRAHFGDKDFTDDLIWTSVKPWGIETTIAYIASAVTFSGMGTDELEAAERSRKDASETQWVSKNLSTIAQSWDLQFNKSDTRTFSIYKHVGIASSDAFPKHTQSTALHTALDSAQIPWSDLVKEHTDAWKATWEDADIVIPGDEELQITARGSLFHLLANSRPGTEPHGLGDNSIMVSGLSSDSYAGLIFWDSDVWMYPALLTLYPEHAMSINNYRSRLLPQALENAQSYNYSGLLFPWTSGRFGNCTGTGLCRDYQYHLCFDVAQAHWHYYLHTKDDEWLLNTGWPIIGNAADMFANYVVKNQTTGQYETKLLGEPDEFAFNINNGAYTNAGIKMLLGTWAPAAAKILDISRPKNWSRIAENVKIPYDEKGDIIIEYDGMDGLVKIKQASVTLINYPLGWNVNERQAQNDMTFYATANTADGPAMTWSMFAINEAQLQDQGCAAYTYLLHGSQPYLRGPFYQFSEQQTDRWTAEFFGTETHAAFPFLTGYGGYLQVFTHGFSGLRPQLDALFLDPMMVPQIPNGVQLRGVKYQGATLDINIGLENTTISRRRDSGRSELETDENSILLTIRIGGKALLPGDHTLRPGTTLTVPTRRPDRNGTAIPGNLAQCRRVSSPPQQPHVPGRLPLAAVDGSNATLWQPATPAPASLVIDLGMRRPVAAISINWGPTPARAFDVAVSDVVDVDVEHVKDPDTMRFVHVFRMEEVTISEPYRPEEAHLVRTREGNLTVATFERAALEARFVRLVIRGTHGNDETVGATVAEVAVL